MRLIWIAALLAALISLVAPGLAPAGTGTALKGGPELVIAVGQDGTVGASGRLPEGLSPGALRKRFPGIALAEGLTGRDSGGSAAGEWERLFDALDILLLRLREGDARIGPGRLGITGTLRPGFHAETTRGAVRLALGSGWEAVIELAEAPPPARVTLAKTAYGTEIRGILPSGLEPGEAHALLGGTAETAMTGGGDGEAPVWRRVLAGLGALVAIYADAEAEIGDGYVEIDGTLLPGYETAPLARWLGTEVGEDWEVRLAGQESQAEEGDTRRDLATGGTERLRRGYWLPEFGFDPTPERCADETARILADGGITFVTGRSKLDPKAAPLLDGLAGVALRCLNEGGLQLLIGGHTDDVGNDAKNLALSERRAMTVLLELIDRGVKADATKAVGHGETAPIADNATEAGRAKNRRISFDWAG